MNRFKEWLEENKWEICITLTAAAAMAAMVMICSKTCKAMINVMLKDQSRY